MASRGKRHKGPAAHRKPAQGTKGTTGTVSSSAETRRTSAAVASRPVANKAAGGSAAGATVRRASATQAGYRSRMNQRKRMRQQQFRILGGVAAVALVGAFAWVFISHL